MTKVGKLGGLNVSYAERPVSWGYRSGSGSGGLRILGMMLGFAAGVMLDIGKTGKKTKKENTSQKGP